MVKQFKVAVTFGRFNLLHKGHLDLFKQMAGSAKEIIIGISTGPNNLTYRQRADVIIKALNHDRLGVANGLFPKRQPFDLLKECAHLKPEDVVFYVGEDQFALAKAVERTLGYRIATIPRLTSSTLVRQTIDSEDWDLLARLVPASIISDVTQLHLNNA